MRTNDLISLAGLILSIPGFFVALYAGQYTASVLALLIIAVIFLYQRQVNSPPFLILEIEKRLVIHDAVGENAVLSRKHRVRANHPGLTEFWCRNIAADGRISNVLLDGSHPDEIKKIAGELHFCKRFPNALERNQEFTTIIEMTLTGSFLQSYEGLIHEVGLRTRVLRIFVKLPNGRKAKKAYAFLRYSGEQHKPLPVDVSEDNTSLSIEIRRPKQGASYSIEWEW